MYIPTETLDTYKSLYLNEFYNIIFNPKLETYDKFDVKSEDHLPNYLVVNRDNGAIEFAADQLAAGADVADKLRDALKERFPTVATVKLN